MMQIDRTTQDGREVSDDGGVTWLLVDPSPAFLAARAATVAPAEHAGPLDAFEAVIDAGTLSMARIRDAVRAALAAG